MINGKDTNGYYITCLFTAPPKIKHIVGASIYYVFKIQRGKIYDSDLCPLNK